MSIEETCRLCRNNLMVKGVITNSRNLFTANPQKNPLHQRFRDVGVILHRRPGVHSSRICVKCYRKLVKVEKALRVLKIWQVYQQSAETEWGRGAGSQHRHTTEAAFFNSGLKLYYPLYRTLQTHQMHLMKNSDYTLQDKGVAGLQLPQLDDEGGTSEILPVLRHVASQTDPTERRSASMKQSNVRSTATQARVPSRDCGVCTLTFPLDSPLLFLQPTIGKRPAKKPRLSIEEEEEDPSECSLSMVVQEPGHST